MPNISNNISCQIDKMLRKIFLTYHIVVCGSSRLTLLGHSSYKLYCLRSDCLSTPSVILFYLFLWNLRLAILMLDVNPCWLYLSKPLLQEFGIFCSCWLSVKREVKIMNASLILCNDVTICDTKRSASAILIYGS